MSTSTNAVSSVATSTAIDSFKAFLPSMEGMEPLKIVKQLELLVRLNGGFVGTWECFKGAWEYIYSQVDAQAKGLQGFAKLQPAVRVWNHAGNVMEEFRAYYDCLPNEAETIKQAALSARRCGAIDDTLDAESASSVNGKQKLSPENIRRAAEALRVDYFGAATGKAKAELRRRALDWARSVDTDGLEPRLKAAIERCRVNSLVFSIQGLASVKACFETCFC